MKIEDLGILEKRKISHDQDYTKKRQGLLSRSCAGQKSLRGN